MSEFTFSDTMAEISLEISEREIYNDIRSEVNVTETETIIDQRAEYATDLFYSENFFLGPSSTIYPILNSPRPVIRWIEAFPVNMWGAATMPESKCDALDGHWSELTGTCIYSKARHISVSIMKASYSDKVHLKVVNLTPSIVSPGYPYNFQIAVRYRYLVQPEESHERTWSYVVKIRRQDPISIRKYGRRVMNLVWPLGQSEKEMGATIEAYLARHKEPMPLITQKIQGRTDELIEQILTRKISDRVTIENTAMGMPEVDFFINSVGITQETGDLLEADWVLEQARDMELVTLFKLDDSLLDGEHVLAY